MLESIIKRSGRIHPLNDTEIKIVRSATKLFLQNGFSDTTFKMIEADSGIKTGAITYYFRTKEDMLLLLIEELLEYHSKIVDEMYDKMKSPLLAYAMEITIQVTLCENNRNARDLYYSAYDHPFTYEYIKSWAAEKTYSLLKDKLPEWTEHDFRDREVITSGIEFAALKTPCDRHFSLDKKVSLILDSMMMLYEVPAEERKKIVDTILGLDYEKISEEMFDRFVKRLDKDVEENG